MSDGIDQGSRLPASLGDAPFAVDEASFAQRVALAARLARHLPFVDLAGNLAGHWGRFFDGDESLVLARMAAVDLEALQRALVRDLEAPPARLAVRVMLLARAVDQWWQALAGCEEAVARVVREEIEHAVAQRLRDDIAWVAAGFGDRAWMGRGVAAGQGTLSSMWRAGAAQRVRVAGSAADTLRCIGFAFLSAIGRLRSLAGERLAESLATGRHEPAAALLAAFLELRGTVQARVNRFASRHVDFYYRDCLGLRPAAARPGTLHLVCRRDPRGEAQVEFPPGTLFDAGRDAAKRPIEFRGELGTTLTDARVAALCTLRLERDPLISPERDFGFATRVKVARLPLPSAADGPSPAATVSTGHPLFGGGAARQAEDARLGLAVATPALALAEGEREIRLHLRVTPAAAGVPIDTLLDEIAAATDEGGFRAASGRLFVRWLIAGEPLSAPQLVRLRAAVARLPWGRDGEPVGVEHPLHLLHGDGPPARELLFERLVDGAFEVRLSTAQGWWTPAASDVAPTRDGGLLVAIRLRRDDPAIVGCDPRVHGAEWTTPLPVLRLDMGARGRLYAFSLLSALDLHEATVDVKVAGLTELVVRNDLGRLDPTRALLPFGPLPAIASSFVFGAPEIACKHLRALTLHIEWSGLPAAAGGFQSWYRGYARAYVPGVPTARPSILRDGHWHDCAGGDVALFASGPQGRLAASRTIAFDPASVRKHARAAAPGSLAGTRVPGGLFRLQLRGPEGAFGHAAHPVVLADAVTLQARLRRPGPRPNPPYTPTIERLSLSYEASDGVRLDRGGAGERTEHAARLFHLHPFGLKELQPAAAGAAHGLLPRLDHDGNLLLGIAADAPCGPLTLLFHLHTADAADPADAGRRPRTCWAYLERDTWRPLAPARVLADTTAGFLKTGTVTLDLPAGIDQDNQVMPPSLLWLRLSADRDFEGFASLHAVHAQALRVVRVLAPEDDGSQPGIPAAAAALAVSAVETRRSVVGLAGVVPVGGVVGDSPRQDERAFRASAGERLRHKQRASTAWDFERLVLDRFPQVAKVKCLGAQDADGAAGRVTVAVVPRATRNVHAEATAMPRLDADQLADIQAFLGRRMSPWVRLRVRNVAYERIQVRCQVQAARGVHEGVILRRVERAIVDHLSPWMDGGCEPRFDWLLRGADIQAHLRGLDGVEAVTRLSLLRIACDDEHRHSLDDTARVVVGEHGLLRPGHPWSLAVPMARHLVSTPQDPSTQLPPAAGIREFAIGSTFIVGDNAP